MTVHGGFITLDNPSYELVAVDDYYEPSFTSFIDQGITFDQDRTTLDMPTVFEEPHNSDNSAIVYKSRTDDPNQLYNLFNDLYVIAGDTEKSGDELKAGVITDGCKVIVEGDVTFSGNNSNAQVKLTNGSNATVTKPISLFKEVEFADESVLDLQGGNEENSYTLNGWDMSGGIGQIVADGAYIVLDGGTF